jgi:serine/threonine protein kinase, bacterial
MPHPLLDCAAIDRPPDEYLRAVGQVFAEFGPQTQDSGNRSYGMQIAAERYFVKTAGSLSDPQPILTHAGRVALLRNAVRLHTICQHPIVPPLYQVIESPSGPLLVYPWVDGELLGVPRAKRDDPQSAFQRFRSLPAPTIYRCLDAIFDLHVQLARAGWVAVDFYDGCLIYDFVAQRVAVVDLDTYHAGPFQNDMGRMFGSTRFMAPEEFERGARIDERTTVFTMGRTALVFLSDGSLAAEVFRGSRALFAVVAKACHPDRAQRFDSLAAFYAVWRAAWTSFSDLL